MKGYQILVLWAPACVARTLNVLIKHRIPVKPEHVDAASMWNAKMKRVYQESARVNFSDWHARIIGTPCTYSLTKLYVYWRRYFFISEFTTPRTTFKTSSTDKTTDDVTVGSAKNSIGKEIYVSLFSHCINLSLRY